MKIREVIRKETGMSQEKIGLKLNLKTGRVAKVLRKRGLLK